MEQNPYLQERHIKRYMHGKKAAGKQGQGVEQTAHRKIKATTFIVHSAITSCRWRYRTAKKVNTAV